PLTVMRQLVDETARRRIVDAATGQVRRTKGPIQNAIRQAFLNQIPGFRDPMRAPVHLLARELNHLLFSKAQPTRDLLGFWKETLHGFDESLREFLDSTREMALAVAWVDTEPNEWRAEDVLALADEYIKSNPGCERADAAVAILDLLWERRHNAEHEPVRT